MREKGDDKMKIMVSLTTGKTQKKKKVQKVGIFPEKNGVVGGGYPRDHILNPGNFQKGNRLLLFLSDAIASSGIPRKRKETSCF
jgi:hypothetical protein